MISLSLASFLWKNGANININTLLSVFTGSEADLLRLRPLIFSQSRKKYPSSWPSTGLFVSHLSDKKLVSFISHENILVELRWVFNPLL